MFKACEARTKTEAVQGISQSPSPGMKSRPSISICYGLAVSLATAILQVRAQPRHNYFSTSAQANTSQSSKLKLDSKETNELAEKLRTEGGLGAASAFWQIKVAIDSTERELGPSHHKVAASLNRLAELLSENSMYSEAERFYRRAQAIYEQTLGSNHPDLAAVLKGLATLLHAKGKYAEAEDLSRRSLVIHEKTRDRNDPIIAQGLNNLALVLYYQGKFAEAEPLYRRAQAIYEKALGEDHPAVAGALSNLATLLGDQGKYSEAEKLYRRSLAIIEKGYGLDNPYAAQFLNNLAWVLDAKGQHAAAETMNRQSLAIRERIHGSNHPAIAESANNIAVILTDQGRYSEAEGFFRRALAIVEERQGSDHPNAASTLNSLAWLAWAQGKHGDSITFLRKSRNIESAWLLRELPLLPDQARATQLKLFGRAWEMAFSLISSYPPMAQLALGIRLNRQGLFPEIEQRQSLLLSTPRVDRIKVERLKALTQQLASVTLPVDRRTEVRNQRDQLQQEIYRQIPELQLQVVTIEAVAKALPADGVLVEFQRYQQFDGRKPKKQRWGQPQYIALVLKPDAIVVSVPLGPAATIDSTIHHGLRATANGLSDVDAIWSKLRDQVIKPLLPHLTGSRQWFISPDGELNRVPFAAIPAPQQAGMSLAQAVQLRLLTTGRELLKLQQPTPTGSPSLVMANPSYDRLTTKPIQESNIAGLTSVTQQRSADLGTNQWKQLPASEREGQKVAKLLSTGLISGSSATTKALQRHQGPRVLHVATHGFFVADQETKHTEPLRAIQEGSPLLRSLRQEDPQLRSGLVFAGANQPDVDPNDDGYLTAAEAVNLNLKGTELVVLSACSTGQGEVRTGEGVYGLQRSLTVAGARSTLLSLWKVDDAATAEFMVRYYQRLKAGEGRSDALAAVQEEFRSGKVQSGTGVDWKEPYYWAAWQLVGDWRPIPGL